MARLCFTLPLLPGRTQAFRACLSELGDDGDGDLDMVKRLGIVSQSWYLQSTTHGDVAIACIEAPSPADALARLSRSRNRTDLRWKRCLYECTGVDLAEAMPGLGSQLIWVTQSASGTVVETPSSSSAARVTAMENP